MTNTNLCGQLPRHGAFIVDLELLALTLILNHRQTTNKYLFNIDASKILHTDQQANENSKMCGMYI